MAHPLKVHARLRGRRLSEFIESRGLVLPLAVTMIACVAYGVATRPREIPYDAGQYWTLATTFDRLGSEAFSFLNFPTGYRGYAFPLICYLIQRVGSVLIGAKGVLIIFNAACFALLHVVLAPALWRQMTGVQPRSPMVWLAAAAGCFLWRGYIAYPLSDLPALTLFVSAIVALHQMRAARSVRAGIAWAAWVGALSGLCVLVRPAYLLAACAAMALALVAMRGLPSGARLSCLAALVVSLFVVVAPQVAVNHHHAGSWSPLPRTEVVFPRGGLYLQQLNWGLTLQRYETDLSAERPRNDIRFVDPIGTRALAADGIQQLDSLGAYLGFVLRHPLDVAAIYVRHAFNGCDLWYATPYVENPRALHPATVLVNLMVWMLVCLHGRQGLSLRAVRRSLPHSLLLLLPVLTVIPVAVEVRFFWPLHLLAVSIACYGTRSGPELALAARRHWLLLVVCLGMWVTLSRSTYAAMPL